MVYTNANNIGLWWESLQQILFTVIWHGYGNNYPIRLYCRSRDCTMGYENVATMVNI